MKLRNILLIAEVIGASLFPFVEARAQEQTQNNKSNINLSGNFINERRFWGMPFLDSPLYDQALNVSKGKISASLVGHRDIKNERWFDFDAVVSYSQPVSDNFSVSAGAVGFYFNLGEGWDTAAVLSAGVTSNLPLNPAITYNRLIKFGGGEYTVGSLSKILPINDNLNISTSVALGYNDRVARDKSGFSHLDARVSVPLISIGDMDVNSSINYIYSLTKEVPSGFLGSVDFNYNLK